MTEKKKSITYKDSGVDIHMGNEFVKKLPSIVNSTFDKNVINGIGDFAGLTLSKMSKSLTLYWYLRVMGQELR